MAGIFLVLFRLVGSELTFRQSLATTLHGMLPFGVAAVVGIATALGLARGSAAQLLGLASTEALVWEKCVAGERASVVLEARRGELYFARYERTAEEVVARVPPCIQQPSELVLEPGETVFATPGLLVPALASTSTSDPTPSAAALLELGLKRLERSGPHAAADLEPLYLRAFTAKPR